MKLTNGEKDLIGCMQKACCTLFPDCTVKNDCKEVLTRLGAYAKGSIILSDWTFDYAKRKFGERLFEDDTSEPVVIDSTHRWRCPKCANEWQSKEKYPCPKCDRDNFLRQRYRELGNTDEEIEEMISDSHTRGELND